MEQASKSANSGLAGLVLAAGAAQRFGAAKQLAQLDGLALVVRAVRALAPACPAGVVVVTGAYQEEVARALAGEPVRCVYNPGWRAGMGSSIGRGLDQLGASTSAALIALADQPGIKTADFVALIDAWQQQAEQPAAAAYEGHTGVPAIFPRSHWPALKQLQGDRGARSLLRGSVGVTAVELPAAAWDVDEPGDLQGRG
ncbi:MAG: nucleotidyltransferase family protein [Gammaproteobacteria bacterium]